MDIDMLRKPMSEDVLKMRDETGLSVTECHKRLMKKYYETLLETILNAIKNLQAENQRLLNAIKNLQAENQRLNSQVNELGSRLRSYEFSCFDPTPTYRAFI